MLVGHCQAHTTSLQIEIISIKEKLVLQIRTDVAYEIYRPSNSH